MSSHFREKKNRYPEKENNVTGSPKVEEKLLQPRDQEGKEEGQGHATVGWLF